MKKKLSVFVKMYVSFTLLSAVSYSCCPEQIFQIRSFDRLSVYELTTETSSGPATVVTDEFFILAIFSPNTTTSFNVNFDFTAKAYAAIDCFNDTFLNRLNEESLIVSLDKDFVFDGETITADSNLTEIKEIKNNLAFSYDNVDVYFLNEFLEKAQFENQEYTFTVYIETTDGLQLEKQVSVTINL